MSAIFILKEEPPKKTHKVFNIVMGGSIDMNAGGFCETSVSFLKSVFPPPTPPPKTPKVMLIWMSKWAKIQQPLKNRQVALEFFISI